MANIRTLVLALGVSAVTAAASVQLTAQAGRSEQAPVAPPRVVGLVGCLERLPPVAGQAGQAVQPAGPAFRLTNVHAADAPPAAGAGVSTTPPAGARPPLVVEQEYLVTAAETVKLADHVNTRVEVTGTISHGAGNSADAASARRSEGAGAAASLDLESDGDQGGVERVQVTVLSARCWVLGERNELTLPSFLNT